VMQNSLVFVQNLVDDIETQLSDDIDIVKLAQRFNVSPWHFQRYFKSLVGDTLGGYIRGRRLTKAAELLLNTEQSVIDIALEVGFGSHEAFTRSFKSYFSNTPTRFRKDKESIRLNEKPLLTTDLFQHLDQDIQREPIIKLRAAQTMVGFSTRIPSPFISNDSYCEQLYQSWQQLFSVESSLTQHSKNDYFGLSLSDSGNFTEQEVEYLAAMAIDSSKLDELPKGMVSHSIEAQWVAEFDVSVVNTDTVNKTIDYIYGFWLPNSEYERGQGSDYELFENIESFEQDGLTSKYVIPIKAK
jgi:AraC family transcriptional regulator